jgi:hypothetical protein
MHLITHEALIAILREQIHHRGGSTLYARRLGVSCAFVSAILTGNKNASGRVLRDLGYERVIAFRKVGAPTECLSGPPGLPASGQSPAHPEAGAK